MNLGVVGAGPAGCLFLACLPPERLSSVVVFERSCIGGDLSRLYGHVVANLTRAELIRAFRCVPQWSSVSLPLLEGDPDTCPLLGDVCLQLRLLMKPILERVKLYTVDIQEIQQVVGGWVLRSGTDQFTVERLVLCTGADPRTLNYPKPYIPLDVALSPTLRTYVRPSDRIVVFGTSHSGTLILRNLHELGCSLTAVYRGSVPFLWARDHHTEGLKQESAVIADSIVAGKLPVRLISLSASEDLVRVVMEADYVVYATGFQSRKPRILGLDGRDVGTFDPATAALAPALWGFGIGFPALYEMPRGGWASDVGFQGFVTQILRVLPTIL